MSGRLVLALAVLAAAAPGVSADSGSRGRVYASASEVRPLEVGQQAPSAPVWTVSGAAADLADRWRESGALLVFYRGGW